MKFLLDVNTSGALANILIKFGHDVARVTDVDPRMSDSAILDWAVIEERIIITTDSDFEQMIWLQGRSHCGVLRLENLPRSARVALLEKVLAEHIQTLKNGAIVIATQQKIRIRRKTIE
ncbi:DUF5615 family PIN-like protein [Nodosilinea sp. FACHB-131]|uniref:DUF5615 family PIN-like protein n=1 Tax=Cyanophyceae TaxID=3028117 RepID=UPI0016832D52|nr:DUF5615 family PIN-like protein [Nodosilinea sp. FACHB-131]MBD1875832.1 DUF5615 family PIN-like protein [Nodosilinea sp. FACHB-131]